MIFLKLRRDSGRLGLWAAVFQSRTEFVLWGQDVCQALVGQSRGQEHERLLGGSHGSCQQKTCHPPGVSVRKHHQVQPALPIHMPGDSTWPQSSAWLWWEPAPTVGAW